MENLKQILFSDVNMTSLSKLTHVDIRYNDLDLYVRACVCLSILVGVCLD